eukprot:gene6338-biopygen7353
MLEGPVLERDDDEGNEREGREERHDDDTDDRLVLRGVVGEVAGASGHRLGGGQSQPHSERHVIRRLCRNQPAGGPQQGDATGSV